MANCTLCIRLPFSIFVYKCCFSTFLLFLEETDSLSFSRAFSFYFFFLLFRYVELISGITNNSFIEIRKSFRKTKKKQKKSNKDVYAYMNKPLSHRIEKTNKFYNVFFLFRYHRHRYKKRYIHSYDVHSYST